MHEAGGADARLAASRGRRPAAAAPRGRPASAAVEESREAQGPREPRGDTRFGACPRSSPARGLPTRRIQLVREGGPRPRSCAARERV